MPLLFSVRNTQHISVLRLHEEPQMEATSSSNYLYTNTGVLITTTQVGNRTFRL